MIKVIVTGALGRMGSAIIRLVVEQTDMELVSAVERKDHPGIGSDIGLLLGLRKEIGIPLLGDLEVSIDKGDVIIEFIEPRVTLHHLSIVSSHKKRMVIGTTGFTPKQLEGIKKISEDTPIVLSPNMSMGTNLMFKLVKEAALILNGYDIEIIEAHHHHKKDSPSGTADRLAHILATALNRSLDEVGVYGRKGFVGERKREEIGILSVRAGDIVGEHTVLFGGDGERLEITHRVTSRNCFAKGAIQAARFISDASPGLYDMGDVLGIR
ncbi:MAG: 4-hydroxy-tetrahydrodipicolinate reductase [bacterium]|nr:4-hydroxy-tetrahydrodipicolinate reductase [bacterium]